MLIAICVAQPDRLVDPQAGERPTLVLTLQQVLDRARNGSQTMALYDQRIETAEARLGETRGFFGTTLATSYRSTPTLAFDDTGYLYTNIARVQLGQSLSRLWLRFPEIKEDRLHLAAQKERVRGAEERSAELVWAQYIACQEALELYRLAQKAVEVEDKHLRRVEAKRGQALALEDDVLVAQRRVMTWRAEALTQLGHWENAVLALNQLIGEAPDTDIWYGTLDKTTEIAGRAQQIELEIEPEVLVDAASASPAVHALALERDALRAASRANAVWMPRLSLVAGYEWRQSLRATGNDGRGFFYGGTFSFPLLDIGAHQARVRRYRSLQAELDFERVLEEEKELSGLFGLRREVQRQLELVRVYSKHVDATRASLALEQERLRKGIGDPLVALDREVDLIRAQSTLVSEQAALILDFARIENRLALRAR
ncbi:MAG: TolC family protein [Proteobacteria bacterium]|nr:TolC family protein [Pseudomonadota bacterium]